MFHVLVVETLKSPMYLDTTFWNYFQERIRLQYHGVLHILFLLRNLIDQWFDDTQQVYYDFCAVNKWDQCAVISTQRRDRPK